MSRVRGRTSAEKARTGIEGLAGSRDDARMTKGADHDLFSFAEEREAREKPPENREPRGPAVITVGQLTQTIKGRLAELGKLAVEGEITQMRVPASGHVYFSLKDEGAVVSCAIWRSKVSRAVPFELKEGMRVVVHGSLDVYAPYGKLQPRSSTGSRQRGLGALLARARAAQAPACAEEGLVRALAARCRLFPRCRRRRDEPGRVTRGSDFLRTRSLRWPALPRPPRRMLARAGAHRGAAEDVAAAIARLDRQRRRRDRRVPRRRRDRGPVVPSTSEPVAARDLGRLRPRRHGRGPRDGHDARRTSSRTTARTRRRTRPCS